MTNTVPPLSLNACIKVMIKTVQAIVPDRGHWGWPVVAEVLGIALCRAMRRMLGMIPRDRSAVEGTTA